MHVKVSSNRIKQRSTIKSSFLAVLVKIPSILDPVGNPQPINSGSFEFRNFKAIVENHTELVLLLKGSYDAFSCSPLSLECFKPYIRAYLISVRSQRLSHPKRYSF